MKGECQMSSKKSLSPALVIMLTLLVLAVVLIPFRGVQLDDVAERVFALTLYGLVVISYILRVGLVFLGVFSAYQVIREHVNVKLATQ